MEFVSDGLTEGLPFMEPRLPSTPAPPGRPGRRPVSTCLRPASRHAKSQQWLDCRFGEIQPCDFDEHGVVLFAVSKYEPPSNFRDCFYAAADEDELREIFTPQHMTDLQNAVAILVIGDPREQAQVHCICLIAELMNRFDSYLVPPMFWVPHTQIAEPGGSVFLPDMNTVDIVLSSGVDGVISGEPAGVQLVLAVQTRMIKAHKISRKINALINHRRKMNAQAQFYEENILNVVWDYLRKRLHTGIPAIDWEIPEGIPYTINEWQVLKPALGGGACGEVFALALPGQGNTDEVVKCMPKSKLTTVGGLKTLKHQLQIMSLISGDAQHPNIVKFYEVYHSETHIIFRLENGGHLNLFKRLHLRDKGERGCALQARKASTLIEQGIGVIVHLHLTCGIAHRDLKPENVCIKEKGEDIIWKLTDFDTAIMTQPHVQVDSKCGTFPFTGPELYLDKFYFPFPTDIWGLGCVLCEILCKVNLFNTALRLPHFARRFQQQHKDPDKVTTRETQHFLMRRVREHFTEQHAVQQMLETHVHDELRPLVGSLWPILTSMMNPSVSDRATSSYLSNMFLEALHDLLTEAEMPNVVSSAPLDPDMQLCESQEHGLQPGKATYVDDAE